MKKFPNTLRLVLAFLVGLNSPQARSDSFEYLFSDIKKTEPSYRIQYEAFLSRDGSYRLALSRLLPQVGLTASRSNIDQTRSEAGSNPLSQQYETNVYGVTIRQVIFNKSLVADLNNSDSVVLEKVIALEDAENQLMVRLTGTMSSYLFSRAVKRYFSDAMEAAKLAQESRMALHRNGRISRLELEEFDGKFELLRVEEKRYSDKYDLETINLKRLIGDKNYNAFAPTLNFDINGLRGLLSRVQYNPGRTVVSELRKRIEVSLAQGLVRKYRAEHFPTVDFVAQNTSSRGDSAYFTRSQVDSVAIGIQVSVPIFSGFGTSERVFMAQSELLQKEYELEALQRDNLSFVESTLRELSGDFERYRVLDGNVKTLSEILDSLKVKYESGFVNLIDIANATERLVRAKIERLGAIRSMTDRLFSYESKFQISDHGSLIGAAFTAKRDN